MRGAIAVASIVVALCTRVVAQGHVLPLSDDDGQCITEKGAGRLLVDAPRTA